MQGKEPKTNYLSYVAPVIILAAAFICIPLWPLMILLPAVAVYLDIRSQTPTASATLLIGVAVLMVLGSSQFIFLMPLALYLGVLPGVCLLIIRMKKLHFFEGLAYAVAASLILAMAGVLIVYFAYGQKDLVTLMVDNFRVWALDADTLYDPLFESFAAASTFLQSMNVKLADLTAITEQVQAMSRAEQIDLIAPIYRDLLSRSGASVLMIAASAGGALTWYLSLLLAGRKKTRKELPLKPPPFVVWRLHRWVTNVLMLVLLVSILLGYTAGNEQFVSGSLALQSMVLAILSVQGMAVIAWLLKRKKVTDVGVFFIIIFIALIPIVRVFTWVGFFDVVFNIRVFTANRGKIKNAMDEMRKNIEKEMQDKHSKELSNGNGYANHEDANNHNSQAPDDQETGEE